MCQPTQRAPVKRHQPDTPFAFPLVLWHLPKSFVYINQTPPQLRAARSVTAARTRTAGPFTPVPPRPPSPGSSFRQQTGLAGLAHPGCAARSAGEANNVLGDKIRKVQQLLARSEQNNFIFIHPGWTSHVLPDCWEKRGANKMCQPIKHIRKKEKGSPEAVFIWSHLEKSGKNGG